MPITRSSGPTFLMKQRQVLVSPFQKKAHSNGQKMKCSTLKKKRKYYRLGFEVHMYIKTLVYRIPEIYIDYKY